MKKKYFISLMISLIFVLCGEDSKSPTESQNNPPIIEEIIISPIGPATGNDVICNAIATDADGDSLTYSWSATDGTFLNSGIGNPITWHAPDKAGDYEITCIVNDSKATSSRTKTITVSLETGIVSGYVSDSVTDEKLSGVAVEIDNISTTTTTNGYFELNDVPTGYPRLFTAELNGYYNYSDLMRVYVGTNTKNIKLERILGRVFGYVFEEGTNNTVVDAQVSIENKTVFSHSNGYYELLNIELGQQIIYANHYLFLTYSDTIFVNTGNNQYDIYLVSTE